MSEIKLNWTETASQSRREPFPSSVHPRLTTITLGDGHVRDGVRHFYSSSLWTVTDPYLDDSSEITSLICLRWACRCFRIRNYEMIVWGSHTVHRCSANSRHFKWLLTICKQCTNTGISGDYNGQLFRINKKTLNPLWGNWTWRRCYFKCNLWFMRHLLVSCAALWLLFFINFKTLSIIKLQRCAAELHVSQSIKRPFVWRRAAAGAPHCQIWHLGLILLLKEEEDILYALQSSDLRCFFHLKTKMST